MSGLTERDYVMAVQMAPVSYSVSTAALATGYSSDQIRRAIRAGDLAIRYPTVNGRQLSKGSILAEDLRAWVAAGKTERIIR